MNITTIAKWKHGDYEWRVVSELGVVRLERCAHNSTRWFRVMTNESEEALLGWIVDRCKTEVKL